MSISVSTQLDQTYCCRGNHHYNFITFITFHSIFVHTYAGNKCGSLDKLVDQSNKFCQSLRSVHTLRYLPCDEVHCRNKVKFCSNAIAARSQQCVNAALQPIHTPAVTHCDLQMDSCALQWSKTSRPHRTVNNTEYYECRHFHFNFHIIG